MWFWEGEFDLWLDLDFVGEYWAFVCFKVFGNPCQLECSSGVC